MAENVRRCARRRCLWPLLFTASALLAQCVAAVEFPLRWRWSNPGPHGGNVVDMAYSPSLQLGVQVAEQGQIFTSGNLDLWIPRESHTTSALRAVTFLGKRVIVTGESGTVLYADDPADFRAGNLVDGPTSAWLEAITASPLLAVAAGDYGSVYTSADGATWKKQSSGTTKWIQGAAFGSGNFVLVGRTGLILTSPNGTNWTIRSSPTSQHLNRVGFANNRFTATGEAGTTISSLNAGTNWFFETTGATNSLEHTSSAASDRIVAGSHEVRIQDGGVWYNELAKFNGPPDWTYYSGIGQPGFFYLAGRTGLQTEGYQPSTNSYFWVTPYDSIRHWLWDAASLPAFYVAAGDFGTILTSGNGVDWTLELPPRQVTNTTLLGITGTTNLLVAVGDTGSLIYSPNIISNVVITNATGVVTQTVSSLGVIWHSLSSPFTTNDLQAAGVLSNSLFLVGGGRGSLFRSTDGSNWVAGTSGTTNFISSIAGCPQGVVAVGDNGTLLKSADGIAWSRVNLGTTNWLYRIRWLNEQLVAVGQSGSIYTSSNANAWVSRSSGSTAFLTDAAFVQDTWFAFGTGGTVLSSSNLVNWAQRDTLTFKSLFAAVTANEQLVVVGEEGIILRSQVVPDRSPVSILNYSRINTNGYPTYNLFLFGGKPDQRFTIDRATNVTSAAWTAGPLLEILDGSGTLYYLETLPGTNLPGAEYYRATLFP